MSGCTETGKPLIAILMAVYEPRMDWLEEQLDSLERQTYPAPDEAPAGNSGVLDFVPAIIAGLSPLADFPELSPQAFRTVIQAAPEELFRNRLTLLFRFLFYGFLFLDLCDSFTSRTRKGPQKRPFSQIIALLQPARRISWT